MKVIESRLEQRFVQDERFSHKNRPLTQDEIDKRDLSEYARKVFKWYRSIKLKTIVNHDPEFYPKLLFYKKLLSNLRRTKYKIPYNKLVSSFSSSEWDLVLIAGSVWSEYWGKFTNSTTLCESCSDFENNKIVEATKFLDKKDLCESCYAEAVK